ncbi:ankyrin repeat-containing domain protein [Armillaria borealis]|uniref:protein S-acyltransferase n=1 Tax=Armillaria borealis TaxID=47425 RepID=A0AA39JLB9_9AGAR|nr:ankyrin repeat-containing domain protein [Armillaria borealis]
MSTLSIHNAAQSNQPGLVKALVTENPKSVNALDADDRTPLHWAASSGSLEITRYLIDNKADIDLPDNSGWTPLHIAGNTSAFCIFDVIPTEQMGQLAPVMRTSSWN